MGTTAVQMLYAPAASILPDIGTLMIGSSHNFAKDKNYVYYLGCGGLVCQYGPVQGADPQTLEEVATTSNFGHWVYGEDANHLYVCKGDLGCTITATIPAP